MDERPEPARSLLHWVEARNHAIDLLEELGIPVDDDWPPYWKTSIQPTRAERQALAMLAAMRREGVRRPDDGPAGPARQ